MVLRTILMIILPSIVQCYYHTCEEFDGKTRKNVYFNGLPNVRLDKIRPPNISETVLQNSVITCYRQDSYKGNGSVYLKIQGTNITTSSQLLKPVAVDILYLNNTHARIIFPEAFQNIADLLELSLADNELTSVPKGVFNNSLQKLESLDLSNNQIHTIEELYFKGFNNLNTLKLSGNRISLIKEKMFQDLASLKSLNLANNRIRTIEEYAFKGCDNLREIYLNENQLSEIGEKMFQGIRNLEILNLTNNQIHKIENFAFKGVNKLTKMWLRNNKINMIGERIFQRAKQLEILDFSQSSMDTLRVSVEDTNIKYFNLSSSGLQTVDFYKFPKCENVDLSQNRITFLTNLELVEISHLNLSQNSLKYINGTIGNVTELTISENQLESFNLNLNRSTDLLRISLNSNRIVHLEDNVFQGLYNLKSLDLSQNNLSLLQQMLFHDLHNLTSLNLSHNHIETFSFGTFNNLYLLESLDISHNRLLKLDIVKYITMSSLQNLYFENNQINSLDILNLTAHFPRLRTISLADNKFGNCQDLVFIFHHLQLHQVTLLSGHRFDVENFYGVACNNKISESNDTADMTVGHFPKEVNSKVKIDEANSIQYPDNFPENEIPKKNGATKDESMSPILIIILLILILISILLCIAIYLELLFFKEGRSEMRRTLTQDTVLEL